jgi:hypothetical protein
VTFRMAASRAAQQTAALDAGDPSTPTTMPWRFVGALISFSLCQVKTLLPERSSIMRL